MHKNSYVLFFAAVVTITCSLLLASAATLLRDRQQENIALDKQKNILVSAELGAKEGQELTRQEILKRFEENIKSIVLNNKGEVISNKNANELNPKKDIGLFPLYFSEKNGSLDAYIIPVSGKGLWSTIYGYLALEADAVTVKGITFYQHGETPGLGGEIEKEWFTNNFKGKKILSPQGELVGVSVVKGKVKDRISDDEAYHYVDGISGSTLTGNGVTNFLKTELEKYEPYFSKIRKDRLE